MRTRIAAAVVILMALASPALPAQSAGTLEIGGCSSRRRAAGGGSARAARGRRLRAPRVRQDRQRIR